MTMFETRILCKTLPKSINDLDKLMLSDDGSTNLSKQESDKKHRKQIRDEKRQRLHQSLEHYETIIEENEFLYQAELLHFEYDLCKDMDETNNLMSCLNNYLNHHTDKMIREVYFKEATFRMKLIHPRHQRKSSSYANKHISVYPEAIVETSENLFTDQEFTLLSCTGKIHFFC